MGGPMSTTMRELIRSADEVSRRDAVDLALTLSVSEVRQQLDEEFLDNYAEEAHRFIQAWLPRLQPLERLQAAAWVADEYTLSMVRLDNSYAHATQVLLNSLDAAVGELRQILGSIRYLTESPDSVAGDDVADNFDTLAARMRTVQQAIATESSRLTSNLRP